METQFPSSRSLAHNSAHDHRSSIRFVDSQRVTKDIALSVHNDVAFDGNSYYCPRASVFPGLHQRPIINGFSPLPTIEASPMFTPDADKSPVPLYHDSDLGDDNVGGSAVAEPPAENISNPKQLLLPTWVSTPPTPPPNIVRRSVTCMARLPAPPIWPPSSPAVTGFQPPASSPKRRLSVPVMPFSRFSRASDPPTASGKGTNRMSSPLRSTWFSSHEPSSTSSAHLTHLQPVFHITHDISTDNEDDCNIPAESLIPIDDGDRSDILRPSLGEHTNNKNKDDMRRFHALLELLATEAGYLMDLKALVTIYLRLLPTLTCRPIERTRASFTAIPRVSSLTNLGPHGLPSTGAIVECLIRPQPITKDGLSPRHLFTDMEIELLTRNAEEILALHEHFVDELRSTIAPFGLAPVLEVKRDADIWYQDVFESLVGRVDEAVNAVCTKFATESSRFNAYQSFCASHPEALDLIRRTQQKYPIEWDDFEQRCSSLIVEMLHTESSSVTEDVLIRLYPTKQQGDDTDRDNHPDSAILNSVRAVAPDPRSGVSPTSREHVIFPTDAEVRKEAQRRARRLVFLDYMIKPVQRICKYPLLLEQLKLGKRASISITSNNARWAVIVESATQAMKHVASSVDEARHRQDVAIQSALILSRISLANPITSNSHLSSVHPPFQSLTSQFLVSLGTCLLAGPLEVIHYQSCKPPPKPKAKYLGAFLYLGGYFILVKVSKNKVYEPKHWLLLTDFDIVPYDDKALLPHSIRLVSEHHAFELVATCRREKEVWFSSFQEALKYSPTWINEPTSSIYCDGKGNLVHSTLEGGPFEAINPLPTIQSIPDIVGHDQLVDSAESNISTIPGGANQTKTLPRMTFGKVAPPSRRSSSTSVKSIFLPLTSDQVVPTVVRLNSTARLMVDQALYDVISEPCLAVRSQASNRDEEAFHVTAIPRSRPSSALSMASMNAGAKDRVFRHQSVREQGKKGLWDSLDTITKKSIGRARSLANRQSMKLSIPSTVDSEFGILVSSDPPSDSPSMLSQCSIVSTSSPASDAGSPAHGCGTSPVNRIDAAEQSRGLKFLIGNMRDFFHSHPTSPVSAKEEAIGPNRPSRLFRRWARGTVHRRARSVPDAFKEQPPMLVVHEGKVTKPLESSANHPVLTELLECSANSPSHHSESLLRDRSLNTKSSIHQRLRCVGVEVG